MKNKTTTNLISEAQSMLFAESMEALVNGVDFNLRGHNLTDSSSEFVLSGKEANKNRVMLWLYSKPGDYIRSPTRGGPLYAVIGKGMSQDDADSIRDSITLEFNSFFIDDLELFEVSVVPDTKRRRWNITLFVRDPIRRELFDIALGVAAS